MLTQMRKVKDITRYSLHATDGAFGQMEECYFDDSTWIIRYFIVNTGDWLTGRKVLISPYSIAQIDDKARSITLKLSRDQIENSPPLASEAPVSRKYEIAYHQYYSLQPYWGSEMLPGLGFRPAPGPAPSEPPPTENLLREEEVHLRSSKEVTGYYIEAEDGAIGHVEDLIFSDQDWTIHYFEVDTANWWPGKKVLIPVSWVNSIRWMDHKVFVSVTREDVQSAPPYDPAKILTREDEITLFNYYARKRKTG